MKLQTILPILFAVALTFFTSCNSNPTPAQYLQDDHHRKDMVHAMVNNQPYRAEMINEMMNNDSCKQMMMSSMMNDPSMKSMQMDHMMSMGMNDSSMFKTMMGKTMEMCDADPAKCKMMMGSMQSHPNVMKSMKGMYDMTSMKEVSTGKRLDKKAMAVIYTCPMHPEIIRDNPGSCPKCGMTLVKKK